MKRTVRGAVAALAFGALVAQPISANASGEAAVVHWFWPVYAATVLACLALTAADGTQVIVTHDQHTIPAVPFCFVPGLGFVYALANHHQKNY